MNTFKSAVVVVVLAGVLYGVYVVLHSPPAPPPPGMTSEQVDAMGPPEVEMAGPADASSSSLSESPLLSARGSEASPAEMESQYPRDSRSEGATGRDSIYGGTAPPLQESHPLGTEERLGTQPPAIAENPSAHTRTNHEESIDPGFVRSPTSGQSLTAIHFHRDWLNATALVNEGKFKEALATLTPYYRSPDLSPETHEQLLAWLDALAGKVIYSQEHHLASAYVVQGSKDQLIDVASQYGVTAQLLQSINADKIDNPEILIPTTKLKVVPGPFRAEVDLTHGEITVFLGDLYAGRFPFVLGNEPPQPGEYQVRLKKQDRTYFGDRTIAAGDPANPYGQVWMDLGGIACIHGSPALQSPGPARGCISLSPQDALDLAAILTVGSKVTIRR